MKTNNKVIFLFPWMNGMDILEFQSKLTPEELKETVAYLKAGRLVSYDGSGEEECGVFQEDNQQIITEIYINDHLQVNDIICSCGKAGCIHSKALCLYISQLMSEEDDQMGIL